MPFRRRSGGQSRYSTFPGNQNVTGIPGNSRDNYKTAGSGIRRHEFSSAIPGLVSIDLGDYAVVELVKMRRSFAGSDTPPTATASNNYQSSQVMNGSKIFGFESKVQISNIGSGNGIYLDVYSIVTSFSEALYLDTVYPSESPIEMTFAADREGEVTFKAPVIWTENTYRNFKGLQRNIKYLGTLFLTSEDGGKPIAEFLIKGLPEKVRRSQTGMFYGLMFHYSATKNTDAIATMDSNNEIKFSEIPAENRLPFRY